MYPQHTFLPALFDCIQSTRRAIDSPLYFVQGKPLISRGTGEFRARDRENLLYSECCMRYSHWRTGNPEAIAFGRVRRSSAYPPNSMIYGQLAGLIWALRSVATVRTV